MTFSLSLYCFTLLVPIWIKTSFSIGVNSHLAKYEELPQWDDWPPLISGPEFTGTFLASRPGQLQTKQSFETIDLFSLKYEHANALLYGNILQKPTFPTVTNAAVQVAFKFAVAQIKQSKINISPQSVVKRTVKLPLLVTGDNGKSQMEIVQRYVDANDDYKRFKSRVNVGINFYMTIEDIKFNLVHQVTIAYDREGQHNMFQHTYRPIKKSDNVCMSSTGSPQSCDDLLAPRIVSYNLWNTNPSNDVYGRSNRWTQYTKRIDHLVEFVKASKASIIGFQEVRYDGTFGNMGNHAQIKHLIDRLPGYQFVYRAAMSYLNTYNPYERIEEGPAILSRYPIIKTDYLLLSRDPNDPNDAHQRICLHAVIDYPRWGLVDIYVTHLSLSERSREKTMLEIWRYIQRGEGVTQVLLGDLNAEPQSRGIRFLQGKEEMEGEFTDLTDAWLEKHEEAEPRSQDPIDRKKKFTFPSDNPSKRIDFILFRGNGVVKECEIIGQEPTKDTAKFSQNLGMLNAKSPVWASDHRGVVMELEMNDD